MRQIKAREENVLYLDFHKDRAQKELTNQQDEVLISKIRNVSLNLMLLKSKLVNIIGKLDVVEIEKRLVLKKACVTISLQIHLFKNLIKSAKTDFGNKRELPCVMPFTDNNVSNDALSQVIVDYELIARYLHESILLSKGASSQELVRSVSLGCVKEIESLHSNLCQCLDSSDY